MATIKVIYKRVVLLSALVSVFSVLLWGQCLKGDSLLKRISFLSDSSKLTAGEQIKILSAFEDGISSCPYSHDSVHVLLLRRIGTLFRSNADYSTGISHFQRLIGLFNRSAGTRPVNVKYLVPCYYWLAIFYDGLHKPSERVRALDSCAFIAMRLKRIDTYSLWALYNRAVYSFDIGDYHRCIDYASLCGSLASDFARNGSKRDFDYGTQYANSSLVWQVNALTVLKKFDDAESLLENKASEAKETGLQFNLGAIYGTLVEVFEYKGEFEKVLYYYNKAFGIAKQTGQAFNCKAMLNNMGYEVWLKHYKNPEKALQFYTQALNYNVTDSSTYRVLNYLESLSILNRIANVFVLKGKFNEAFRYIQRAFDQIKPGITETELLQSSLDEFIAQRRIGYIATLIVDKAIVYHQRFKATGNLADLREAVRIYKVADQFLEKIKVEQSDVRSKLFWRNDRRRLYELAIDACHAYGNKTDAFYFFERSRAVLLYDELNQFRLMSQDDIKRQAQLRKSVAQLDRELALQTNHPDTSRKLREEAMEYRQELDQLDKQINGKNPLFYRHLSETNRISLDIVQRRLLKAPDILIEFFEGDSAVYSMMISQTQVHLEKINKDSFDRLVTGFVTYVSSSERLNRNFRDFVTVSHQLYKLIFQNLSLSPGKIIVSPDGRYFPAEALVANDSSLPIYLIQNHPISYAHSATLLMIDFNAKTDIGDNFLGLAPVNFPATLHLPTLSGSDGSLRNLRANFHKTKCLIYSDASKGNFVGKFSEYKIIQLYTHGSTNGIAGEPEIYFADSVLHLSELMSEKKPVGRLIVLSACETGAGEWYPGEGVFSFSRGFAGLGIPSAVSNLWSVEDKATYQLTELFYKELAKGELIDVALQKAKLEFIKNSASEKSLPYYWAATILAGKTDAIDLSKPFPWKSIVLVVFLGCVLFFGYVLWKRKQNVSHT